MKNGQGFILVVNGGSSSIKFAVYQDKKKPLLLLGGAIENMGTTSTSFAFYKAASGEKKTTPIKAQNVEAASTFLIDWLRKNTNGFSLQAIGHRIVYGMKHTSPEPITPELITQLKKFVAYDPEHLPGEIQLIEAFAKHFPHTPQVACFDTSFHTTMPPVAKLLAIPRKYRDMRVERYGFHGLSYSYLLAELERIAGGKTARGKIIMAHLGSGASLAAIKDGKSIDTTMGFTPASGLPMSTRSGDLDPGVAAYILQTEKLTPKEYNHIINHQSGLVGISGTTGDMQELIRLQATDTSAAEAVDFFCYQTKKWMGAYSAALEGLDTVVFSGGIGENAPEVRRRICNGLQFLGIELDERSNKKNTLLISKAKSKVKVYVIKTDEQLMMAGLVSAAINS